VLIIAQDPEYVEYLTRKLMEEYKKMGTKNYQDTLATLATSHIATVNLQTS
jgi:predicted house-cleaning noncanonical NTP pyrophosphatase (MazG superfamily)